MSNARWSLPQKQPQCGNELKNGKTLRVLSLRFLCAGKSRLASWVCGIWVWRWRMDEDWESRKLEEKATYAEPSVHRAHCDLSRVCLPTPTCHGRLSYPETFLQDPVFRDTQLPACQPQLSYALPSESVPLCIPWNLLSNPISQTKWQGASVSWSVKWGW